MATPYTAEVKPSTAPTSSVTVRAKDRTCPGCGGKGGAHKLLHCAYLADDVKRAERKGAR